MAHDEKEKYVTLKAVDQPESDPLIGAVIADRYRITSCIGKGGMGAVYKAEHQTLQKPVAIKVLQQSLATNESAKQRFFIEAKAASQLNHPHLACVHDYGVCPDGSPYLVMDYVAGQSLSQILKSEDKLAPDRALKLFIQICEGLSAAHKNGVIHRDLKPSNIVIEGTPDNESVKIIDFGIAKITAGSETPQVDVTRTGEIVGTPMYMSPEQLLGHKVDGRTDMYSLGCIMYETLSGKPPFMGESAMEMAMKHIHDAAPTIEASPGTTHIASAIARCLQKDPTDRYESMDEVTNSLKGIAYGARRPVSLRQKHFRRGTLIATAAILVVLFGVVMVANFTKTPGLDEWDMYMTAGEKAFHQGHFTEAESMFVEADKKASIFPPNDRRRYVALHRKSDVKLYNLNKAGETEPAFKQLVNVFEHKISDPEMLAEVSADLAQVYWDQRKYTEGEVLFHKAIAISDHNNDKAEYARHLQNYGNKLMESERYAEAEPFLKKSLWVRQNAFGKESIEAAYSLEVIGHLYFLENDTQSAKKYLSEALQIRKEKLGDLNPFVAHTADLLADVYANANDYKKAEQLYVLARDIYDKNGDPALTNVLEALGEVYYWEEKYTECGAAMDRAIGFFEKQQKPDKNLLASALQYRAGANLAQGDPNAARPMLQRALKLREDKGGTTDIQYASVLADLARTYDAPAQYETGKSFFDRSITLYEKNLPESADEMSSTLKDYAELLSKAHRPAEAAAAKKRAMALAKQAE